MSIPLWTTTWAKKTKKDEDFATRDYMIEISRHLGVTCSYCHDLKNFRSDNIVAYKTAKKHMDITQWLNKDGFKGKPKKVDCYLCHRGKAKPDFLEPHGL